MCGWILLIHPDHRHCTYTHTHTHTGELLHTHLLSELGAKLRKGGNVFTFPIDGKMTAGKQKHENEGRTHRTPCGVEPPVGAASLVQYKALSLGAGSAQAKPDHKKRHYRVTQ